MKRSRAGAPTATWSRHKRDLIVKAQPIEDPTYNRFCDACGDDMKKVAYEKWSIEFPAQFLTICSACMEKNWCRVVRPLRVGEVLQLWWNGIENVYACVRDVYPGGVYCIVTDDVVAFGEGVKIAPSRIHFIVVGQCRFSVFTASMEGMNNRKLDLETCSVYNYAHWLRAPRQSVGVSVYTLEGKRVKMIEEV